MKLFKHDNITGTKCPKCDDFMLEVENKQGKFLRCKTNHVIIKRISIKTLMLDVLTVRNG